MKLPRGVANVLDRLGLVKVAEPERFETEGVSPDVIVQVSAVGALISFLHTLMFIFALMLMFQRNRGFSLGGFLVSCCCTPCYLAYALAAPVGNQKISF